jgi:hypothetical protein
MKRLSTKRYRAAARAGLSPLRPRPESPREPTATEAARHGYHVGWFAVRGEGFGSCSRVIYVFGAVRNLPDAWPVLPVRTTFCYDASGPGPAALGQGAVTTHCY